MRRLEEREERTEKGSEVSLDILRREKPGNEEGGENGNSY